MPSDIVAIVSSIFSIISFGLSIWELWRGNSVKAWVVLGVACLSIAAFFVVLRTQEVQFEADSYLVNRGSTTKLNWHVPSMVGTSIALDGDPVGPNGVKLIEPQIDTTYRLVVNSVFGLKFDKSITVHVRDTIVEFDIQPDRITTGESAKLVWKTNAPAVKIDGEQGGELSGSGEHTVRPTSPGEYVYTLAVLGPGGRVTQEKTLRVVAPAKPVLDVVANPNEIQPGQQAKLIWHANNANCVEISGPEMSNGCQDPAAPLVVRLEAPGEYDYTFKATGPGGDVTRAISIRVSNDVPQRLAIIVDPRETRAAPEELTQVRDTLINDFRHKYTIVRSDIAPMNAEQYLSWLQSHPEQVMPTFISLATVRLYRTPRQTHLHGLRLDVTASATIKLLQVDGSTLAEMTTVSGEGQKKDIAYTLGSVFFAGPSEQKAVGDALMRALSQLATAR